MNSGDVKQVQRLKIKNKKCRKEWKTSVKGCKTTIGQNENRLKISMTRCKITTKTLKRTQTDVIQVERDEITTRGSKISTEWSKICAISSGQKTNMNRCNTTKKGWRKKTIEKGINRHKEKQNKYKGKKMIINRCRVRVTLTQNQKWETTETLTRSPKVNWRKTRGKGHKTSIRGCK